METKVFTVISAEEAKDLLLDYYVAWFKARDIKQILTEDKHHELPYFGTDDSGVLISYLEKSEILDFIKEKFECDEIILEHKNKKTFLGQSNQEEDDDEEDEDEEEDEEEEYYCEDDEEDEDEDYDEDEDE